jgi:hypothetical protein
MPVHGQYYFNVLPGYALRQPDIERAAKTKGFFPAKILQQFYDDEGI